MSAMAFAQSASAKPCSACKCRFERGGPGRKSARCDERWLTIKPEKLSFGTAAACGVSGLVAFSAIHALKLRAGLRIVIVGATGGIGGMAVQLAARAGAEVIGVCGPAHVERAYRLGCSLVLDYHGEPWDRTLRAEGGARIDGVLDLVGGRDVEEAGRRVLGTRRRLRNGRRPGALHRRSRARLGRSPGRSGTRRLSHHQLSYPRAPLRPDGTESRWRQGLADVAGAAAAGVLPPIDSTVPFELEPMRQALRRAAAHQNNGRIVIQMDKAG